MSFKKPSRAVPIRRGAHYAAQRRKRRQGRFFARLAAGALVCGTVGFGSMYMRGHSDGATELTPIGQPPLVKPVPDMPQPAMSAAQLDAQQPSSGVPAVAATRREGAASRTGWSYRNCREARAAGAAPLYAGQPGYGAHMDGDGDNIACEPYAGPH